MRFPEQVVDGERFQRGGSGQEIRVAHRPEAAVAQGGKGVSQATVGEGIGRVEVDGSLKVLQRLVDSVGRVPEQVIAPPEVVLVGLGDG